MESLNKTEHSLLTPDSSEEEKHREVSPLKSIVPLKLQVNASQSKLPFFVKYLAIYDIDNAKYVLQLTSLSASELQVDSIEGYSDTIIEKVAKFKSKGKVAIDYIQSHKTMKGECYWVTIINENKLVLAGSFISVVS